MGHTHKQLVRTPVVLSALIRGMTKNGSEVQSTTYGMPCLSSVLEVGL